jgi:hypothetical protein
VEPVEGKDQEASESVKVKIFTVIIIVMFR